MTNLIKDAANRTMDLLFDSRQKVETRSAGTLVIAIGNSTSQRRRIVLISRIDDESQIAMIHLATDVIEAATDFDLIASPAETGAPYTLVLEAELYGPVFLEQLADSIGQLAKDPLIAFGNSLQTDGESLISFHSGLPLGDEDDPRRLFKLEELSALDQLVNECRSWIAGTPGEHQTFDPALLIPPATGSDPSVASLQFLELLDAVNAVGRGIVTMPIDYLLLLEESGILNEMERWQDFGFDPWRVLSQIAVMDSEVGTVPPTTKRMVPGSSDFENADAVLIPFLRAQASRYIRVFSIHTSQRCDRYDKRRIIVNDRHGRTCRARVHIIERVA